PNTRCNNNGYIDKPNTVTTSTLNGDGSLTGAGADRFAIVPVSAVTWAGRLAGLGPIPLNFGPASYGGITAGFTTANLIFTAIQDMTQNIHFTPRVDVTVAWGSTLGYEIVNGSNVHVSN